MINRRYAEGRESSSACGVQPYEQTRIGSLSQGVPYSPAGTRPSHLPFPILPPSNLARSTEAFPSFSLDPNFIPLNKHHSQNVSLKTPRVVRCTMYSGSGLPSRSRAAGKYLRYMSTGDVAARGQRARGGGQGSS